MSDYLTAYRERLQRNNDDLIKLIKEVQERDPLIEAYVHNDGRLFPGVVFIKDETINSIHFHEVPYRWSGCGYHEHWKSHWGGENASLPFDATDVITTMRPIGNVNKTHDKAFKNKEEYLKWCSYLKLYKHEEK
jgi:hypothetical protein